MLGGVLDLRDLQVADIMVHRTKMDTINGRRSAGARCVDEMSQVARHSRVPIWKDEPENIVGVLHTKDLLGGARARLGWDPEKLDVMSFATRSLVRAGHDERERTAQPVPEEERHRWRWSSTSTARCRASSRSRIFWKKSSGRSPTSTTRRKPTSARRPTARSTSMARSQSAISTVRWAWSLAGRRSDDDCRTRHPRGAGHSGAGPGVQVPRLPLRGAAQGAQQDHGTAHQSRCRSHQATTRWPSKTGKSDETSSLEGG